MAQTHLDFSHGSMGLPRAQCLPNPQFTLKSGDCGVEPIGCGDADRFAGQLNQSLPGLPSLSQCRLEQTHEHRGLIRPVVSLEYGLVILG